LPGEAIVLAGRLVDALFFVIHGVVEVVVKSKLVTELHDHAYFGEQSFFACVACEVEFFVAWLGMPMTHKPPPIPSHCAGALSPPRRSKRAPTAS